MFRPQNEQGVVFLFAQYCVQHDHTELVSIRSEFPDAVVRTNGTEDWRVEFEFVASNFIAHNHDARECDAVVCWVDDCGDMPFPVMQLRDLSGELCGATKADDIYKELFYWKQRALAAEKRVVRERPGAMLRDEKPNVAQDGAFPDHLFWGGHPRAMEWANFVLYDESRFSANRMVTERFTSDNRSRDLFAWLVKYGFCTDGSGNNREITQSGRALLSLISTGEWDEIQELVDESEVHQDEPEVLQDDVIQEDEPPNEAECLDMPDDPLLVDAAFVYFNEGYASASLLQRKMRVGYNRASRMYDALRGEGIVLSEEAGPGFAVDLDAAREFIQSRRN